MGLLVYFRDSCWGRACPSGSHESMRALPCRSVLCHGPVWWQSPSTGQIHVTRVLGDGGLRVRPSGGAASVAGPRRRDSQVPIRPPPRASLQPLSILSAECTLGARTLVGTEDTVLHVLLSAGCWSRPCGLLRTRPPEPGTPCHLPGRAGVWPRSHSGDRLLALPLQKESHSCPSPRGHLSVSLACVGFQGRCWNVQAPHLVGDADPAGRQERAPRGRSPGVCHPAGQPSSLPCETLGCFPGGLSVGGRQLVCSPRDVPTAASAL